MIRKSVPLTIGPPKTLNDFGLCMIFEIIDVKMVSVFIVDFMHNYTHYSKQGSVAFITSEIVNTKTGNKRNFEIGT